MDFETKDSVNNYKTKKKLYYSRLVKRVRSNRN